ncbi:hypothetical protein LBMAG53_37980 [Planctomycetota bacterium]|nr:hypothetical protein LBMAG53_37980 [Planctomycetota bacterium]
MACLVVAAWAAEPDTSLDLAKLRQEISALRRNFQRAPTTADMAEAARILHEVVAKRLAAAVAWRRSNQPPAWRERFETAQTAWQAWFTAEVDWRLADAQGSIAPVNRLAVETELMEHRLFSLLRPAPEGEDAGP